MGGFMPLLFLSAIFQFCYKVNKVVQIHRIKSYNHIVKDSFFTNDGRIVKIFICLTGTDKVLYNIIV